jgi:hypothetical protein
VFDFVLSFYEETGQPARQISVRSGSLVQKANAGAVSGSLPGKLIKAFNLDQLAPHSSVAAYNHKRLALGAFSTPET